MINFWPGAIRLIGDKKSEQLFTQSPVNSEEQAKEQIRIWKENYHYNITKAWMDVIDASNEIIERIEIENLEDNKDCQKKYKTKFNCIIDDWVRVKNHCRTTDNKDFTEKEPTEEFKRKLLISEHSPIRLIEIDWSWEDIYSWVATHWSRHKFEKFISTQRDDRKEHDIPRGEMPQNTPVKFDGYANMQSLIDSFRKRLCYQASPETRELAEDFKTALMETEPELAEVLVPNCVYRCSCPEFKTCGYFNRYLLYVEKWFENEGLSSRSNIGYYRDICMALSDIQTRYSLYNKMFKEEF